MPTIATIADPVGTTAGAGKEGTLTIVVGGAYAVSRVKKAEGVMVSLELKIDIDAPVSPLEQPEVSTTSTSCQKDSRYSKP